MISKKKLLHFLVRSAYLFRTIIHWEIMRSISELIWWFGVQFTANSSWQVHRGTSPLSLGAPQEPERAFLWLEKLSVTAAHDSQSQLWGSTIAPDSGDVTLLLPSMPGSACWLLCSSSSCAGRWLPPGWAGGLGCSVSVKRCQSHHLLVWFARID